MPGKEFPLPESRIENLHIRGESIPLLSPLEVKSTHPATENSITTAMKGREAIRLALNPGLHSKLILVVGPCSVDNPDSALEYAKWLKKCRAQFGDQLELIMRLYFEKPRTTVGWEGLITDPHLDESFDFNNGLLIARKLACDITNMGIPIGTELLDPITPDYYAGLMSWGAIGARTTQSPLHRHLASGLSFPIGFKNGTEGNVDIAIDALETARHPHHFPGTTEDGRTAVLATMGNPDCHVILRGGSNGPNYDSQSIDLVTEQLIESGHNPNVMVDPSHANSGKDYRRQILVVEDLARQIAAGSKAIMGVMIESNLKEGSQPFIPGSVHKYGVSITDGCVGLEETARMFELLYAARVNSPS